MKVGKKLIRQDMLSFEHEGYNAVICTHYNQIIVNISKNGKLVFHEWLTVAQFVSMFTIEDTIQRLSKTA